ncbi:MAG: hypothetical protein KGD64_01755 [Candidatus Heimdallarchaeota archaeon]|nr:hypothetical protein [Candidatus Heimdallarchaeota archaeon]
MSIIYGLSSVPIPLELYEATLASVITIPTVDASFSSDSCSKLAFIHIDPLLES